LSWREIEGKGNKNENEVLKIMRLFSITYSDKKEKATTENARLSPCVAFSYKLSNKFIEDFERIMDFVEYKHIVLKPHKVGNGIK
jgi:hypothetical protein